MAPTARRAPAALAAAFALAAATAHAQPARPDVPALADPERVQARGHFERGVARAAAGQWAEAAAEFEAARQLSPTLPLLYNLGVALQATGRLVEARTTLREFRALAWTELTAARREELEQRLQRIEAVLGELRLAVEPASAAVFVDGRLLPPGVSAWPVAPGAHRLSVEADGYAGVQRGFSVAPGGREMVRVSLAPRRAFATVAVRYAPPGAVVTVDAERVPSGEALEVVPGRHRLRVEAPGRLIESGELTLRAGERRELTLDPPRNLVDSPVFWGVATPVLVGLAAGAVVMLAQ
ncbi:MAG: tetratricopeptide repeat protein [Polyangiales bacterium]